MSVNVPEEPTDEMDTGDLLHVEEHLRLDYDDFNPEEVNADEFTDFDDVPDGEVVTLSTAHLDEQEV